ncbi:MAG: SOS response-associated peptidase [Clostridia bacterium]|nr:SOS response-associated peptidase [Clostridia bacterium]
MCGRYWIDPEDTPEELAWLLQELEERERRTQPDFRLPRGEITPGMLTLVRARSRAGKPRPFAMRWGLPLDRRLVINARSETAAARPLFRESLRNRRCLIPASAYFEWDHRVRPAPKYRFFLPDSPCFSLAGLYRVDMGERPVFTVLTREPTPALAAFHDRMPLILRPEDEDAWLGEGEAGEVMARGVTEVEWVRE